MRVEEVGKDSLHYSEEHLALGLVRANICPILPCHTLNPKCRARERSLNVSIGKEQPMSVADPENSGLNSRGSFTSCH